MSESAEHPLIAAQQAARSLAERLGGPPEVAVVLGSGWAAATSELGEVQAEVGAQEVPGFLPGSAPGHAGRLALVGSSGLKVLVLAGRIHLYEGHSAAAVVHPVRAAVLAGAGTVILTNAAGAIRPGLPVGLPVLISDQINLTGQSPLLGARPTPPFKDRFLDSSRLYDQGLRDLARRARPELPQGVYAGVLGPQYETPAEIRALRQLGADLVGMSTVLEAVAAHHLGARVLGISLVTNLAAGLSPDALNGGEVLAVGRRAASNLGQVLREVLARLALSPPGPK
ncbi:MAG: purine-nucleoside phosphorylase [Candidatus Dormibacteria bacterium]